MRKLLFIFVILNSLSAYAINDEFECQKLIPKSKTVFTLTITGYFDRGAEFKLCKAESSSGNVLLSGDPRNRSDFPPRQINLNQQEFDDLEKLFDGALAFNLHYKESFPVLDGSTWCLKFERSGMSAENCFWSPYEAQESRELKGLTKLGEKLWQIADGEKRYGKLR